MNDYQLPVILTREFDLGVAVTRLIAGGVIERYPDLQFVFPTSAGDWPVTKNGSRARRIVSSWLNRSRYFDRLYFDMAGFEGSPIALRCALGRISRSAWFSRPIIRRISTTVIRSREKTSMALAEYIRQFGSLPLDEKGKRRHARYYCGEVAQDRSVNRH